jgi:putative drug exporter of the RND superfamily
VALSVLLATFVIMMLLTYSLLAPLSALIVNSLTIAMAYGTIVFIFQQGRFETLLDYTSLGFVDAVMPIIMFCALYGVAMDYEVFLLARMHESWHRTGSVRGSVAAGLTRSARVIVSAAALVVVVAMAFAFTSISMTKELGIGMAVAIAFDAVFIRCMLVPALMLYMGRWAWWMPRWLGGRLPDLSDDVNGLGEG